MPDPFETRYVLIMIKQLTHENFMLTTGKEVEKWGHEISKQFTLMSWYFVATVTDLESKMDYTLSKKSNETFYTVAIMNRQRSVSHL